MRNSYNLKLSLSPDTEELVITIDNLPVSQRYRCYRMLQKFFVDCSFHSLVSVDACGVPDSLVLYLL